MGDDGDDLLATQEDLEELGTEEVLQCREVHVVGGGMEDAVADKDTESREAVGVWMMIEKRPVRLRRGHHGGTALWRLGNCAWKNVLVAA
jgi:hypothetical protein